jgi:translation initiation factor 3 subunit M
MVASSTLVNVAEDAELRLISFMADNMESGSQFQDSCTACITGGDVDKLISTICSETVAMQNLQKSTAAATLLAALIASEEKCHHPDEAVTTLVNALVQVTTLTDLHSVQQTLNVLSVLYNMLIAQKCQLLQQMILLAGNHKDVLLRPDTVLGKLVSCDETEEQPRLVHLLDAWKESTLNRQLLYKTVYSVCDSPQYLLLLVKDDSVNDPQYAKAAAIQAIRDPVTLFRQQRNLLQLKNIQKLQTSDPNLFAVLTIFQHGKLSDYQKFFSGKNEESVLGGLGLQKDSCQRYIRILSLCSLAAEHEEIPYGVIAETLEIPVENVETWVIAAIQTGLLAAKMDQLRMQVMVEQCVVRQFDSEQWKLLQKRLKEMKDHVGSVLEALKQQAAATNPN